MAGWPTGAAGLVVGWWRRGAGEAAVDAVRARRRRGVGGRAARVGRGGVGQPRRQRHGALAAARTLPALPLPRASHQPGSSADRLGGRVGAGPHPHLLPRRPHARQLQHQRPAAGQPRAGGRRGAAGLLLLRGRARAGGGRQCAEGAHAVVPRPEAGRHGAQGGAHGALCDRWGVQGEGGSHRATLVLAWWAGGSCL